MSQCLECQWRPPCILLWSLRLAQPAFAGQMLAPWPHQARLPQLRLHPVHQLPEPLRRPLSLRLSRFAFDCQILMPLPR